MPAFVRWLVRDDAGQDLVEYALLSALITLVAAAGVSFFGDSIANGWSALAAEVPDLIGL
jgi:Flp pilus assembly pilin Flp